jgi:D-alanine-D-alanine ligase-like ATP-grasp enzyme
MIKDKNFCKECGQSNWHHFSTWLEELTNHILPPLKLPPKIEAVFDILPEKILTAMGLAKFRTDFTSSDIQLRTTCFIEEMKKRGAVFHALQSIFGTTNHFKMEVSGKTFRFETLPTADFASKYNARIVDDKELTKRHCKKGGFPVAEGKAFWFWQKRKAVQFGQQIGFPLVVKPRGGSVSRHVTTRIQNEAQLKKAICHAVIYSPMFIVEKFIPNASVYRATIIDFDFAVCVQQVPANVVGDGISTIRELIDKKNSDPRRGETQQRQFTLYKIVENETTKTLLAEKGYDGKTIPPKGEVVYIQKDPFLKLGGDLVEVTTNVHKDNLRLFSDLARFFDVRVTGIDFLARDIAVSWKNQPCAILELNSVPCIELHHFPSSGIPTNPAGALADMFFKYYL